MIINNYDEGVKILDRLFMNIGISRGINRKHTWGDMIEECNNRSLRNLKRTLIKGGFIMSTNNQKVIGSNKRDESKPGFQAESESDTKAQKDNDAPGDNTTPAPGFEKPTGIKKHSK